MKLKIEVIRRLGEAQVSCHDDKRVLLSFFRRNGQWCNGNIETFKAGMTREERWQAVGELSDAISQASDNWSENYDREDERDTLKDKVASWASFIAVGMTF